MKIALGIEYNGKQYCGWQRQEKVRSVQEELEKALSFVANEKIEVFCSNIDSILKQEIELRKKDSSEKAIWLTR